MSENLKTSGSDIEARLPIDSLASVSPSVSALARRRMLLASLGKGSAAVALVVPIQTLAATTIVGGNKLCTVSGVQSNVGSHPLGTPTTCQGNSPTFFQTLANWPGYTATPKPLATFTVDGILLTNNSKFSDVFPGGANTKLDTVLVNTPGSDDAVWVTALLNALKNTYNFPYTASQVRAFYNGGGPLKAQALAFFKDFMQTVG